ncbi:MAG: protein-L-isoaspartate(D-aspartate) O-methyltransferase [Candidatus Woesearchaeota archaeon]
MTSKSDLLQYWSDRFAFSKRELAAFTAVHREDFIPSSAQSMAYEDIPLPTLRGKTVSQPTTVMIMTHALDVKKGMKVFEVGTGSGYQSAILAHLVGASGKVVTTEIIPELVQFARLNIMRAGYENIVVLEEDGPRGHAKEAPFDRIILTAAAKEFPPELVKQLKLKGIILGPLGTEEEQQMVRGTKNKQGGLDIEFLGSFLFSPLAGKHGFVY